MKLRITALSLLIIMTVAAFMTPGTYAWFTDLAANKKIFVVGDIQYEYIGRLVDESGEEVGVDEPYLVVPGDNLIAEDEQLELINHSNIDTNLRIQILVSYKIPAADEESEDQIFENVVYNPSNSVLSDYLQIAMADNWVFVENTTELKEDGFYVYKYDPAGSVTAAATAEGKAFRIPAAEEEALPEELDRIAILKSITFEGEGIKNEMSGTIFEIKLIFQAKQHNHLLWSLLGTDEIKALAAQ